MRHMILLVAAAGCGSGGSGASCPAFASIVDGSFTRTGRDVAWTLDVEALSTVTFDQATTPLNVLEYQWGVELDRDRDGRADFRVAATAFKQDRPPETTADVL